VVRIEFTVEPFDDGRPGPHVAAAIRAVEAAGAAVDVGPFGSACLVPEADAGRVLDALADAAVANGASHVSIHLEVIDGGGDAAGGGS
jgi:hypothetical protein